MGADIHYAIEAQDPSGNWHALYLSNLGYTEWWRARVKPDKHTYEPDDHGFAGLRSRNYTLFGVLSNVRERNPFSHLGSEEGIANPGFPDDVTAIVDEHYGPDDADIHSQGWLSGDDLTTLEAALSTMHPMGEESVYGRELALGFVRTAKSLMALLAGGGGKPGLIGAPIGHIPGEDEDENPNAPVTRPASSTHATLAMVALLQSGQGIPLSRMRILIGYDN